MNLQPTLQSSKGSRTLTLVSAALAGVIVIGAVVILNSHDASHDSAALSRVEQPSAAGTTTGGTGHLQELVAVTSLHKAYARPSASSPSMGSLSARTTITEMRTIVPVLAHHGAWLKVELPGRPNGHTGWISSRGTNLRTSTWHLVLDLSTRKVTALRHGQAKRVFKAVVGKASTPTPRGDFYVEESVALGRTEVGAPFALALSARSNVFQHFAGGPGQIALHGLNNVGGVPGTAVSHGCIRLTTKAISWLVAHIAPGVTVTIKK
jgi:lipoprotein-anchoring transpeptidase ErfK/SrfK